jgi:hypothetical protein
MQPIIQLSHCVCVCAPGTNRVLSQKYCGYHEHGRGAMTPPDCLPIQGVNEMGLVHRGALTMKPMMKLSHCVLATRCSSWIQGLTLVPISAQLELSLTISAQLKLTLSPI